MCNKKNTLIMILHLNWCTCLAEYELFPGFDPNATETLNNDPSNSTTEKSTIGIVEMYSKLFEMKSEVTNALQLTNNSVTNVTISTTTETFTPFVCPEEEKPSNIGPYEVPTQRDLALHMKRKLLKLFNNYHSKALFFLNDIKEATRSTLEVEQKCSSGNKTLYKKCVKRVSHQCELITKSMVRSLETQRQDVLNITEDTICNVKAMKIDPVQFIKVLAMEVASLEFALPGFLRLLSSCTYYCDSSQSSKHRTKPTRHMTDQDLVIKHFLTRKNYVQLIKN